MIPYLRLELLRTLRSPAFAGYTIGFPVTFYLLFTTVFRNRPVQGVDFAAYYMASMAIYGAIGVALNSVGARIALERTRGWTRQLALSPLRPGSYIAVKVVSAGILSLPVVALILLAGRFINGVHLSWRTWLGLFPALWLGALPFAALGIAIGYTFRDELAQAASLTTYFLLSVAGGLWMPVQAFPRWLAAVAKALPSYRAGELSWRLLQNHQPLGPGVIILAAWTTAFTCLAAWRYLRAR
jgi:ABC-2 type transport system permease protein